MPVTIELPQVGESVTEGTIAKWLKKVGDSVEKYEPLVEVMTDKVNMEVPSPFNGTLTAILVKEGATIPMGVPIAEMETDEAPEKSVTNPTIQPTQPKPSIGRIGVLLKDVRPVGPTGSGEEPDTPESVDTLPTLTLAPKTSPDAMARKDRQRYSPVVRRLAAQQGINLANVPSSGMGGRVTKDDVLRHIDSLDTTPKATQATQEDTPSPVGPDEEVMELTPVRRLIAENMVKSATQIPHAWSSLEVDVTSLVALRENVKAEFVTREGVELTYLPFFIRAVVEALRKQPIMNSSWSGNRIIIKKQIHIGIAVATSHGLIVPVIHDTDTLGLAELARSSRDLILRARESTLRLNDVQGGTFTLNNTGVLGSLASQPLVNPPQAAIITTEAVTKRPVVTSGDIIAVRSMMNVCVSFDHRILDGAAVGVFMSNVKNHLEAISPDTSIH